MGKTRDLTGQVFGRLTVLHRLPDRVSKSGKSRVGQWRCRCDCGSEIDMPMYSLRVDKNQSCGCADAFDVNLWVGKQFGQLTVICQADEDYISPKGQRYVKLHCKCECGNELDVTLHSLKKGHTQSCGCYRIKQHKAVVFKDLTGQRFGRLVVMYQVESDIISGKPATKWHCKCDCGNEVDVLGRSLTSGSTQSCGCYQKDRHRETHFQDLTGRRFGRLVVMYRAENSECGRTRWHCKCDCGNEVDVLACSLKNGSRESCGCLHFERCRETQEKNRIDLTGQVFGRWTVLYRTSDNKWRCRCECGTERDVVYSNLVRGLSTSCGCYASEQLVLRQLDDLTGRRFGKLVVLYQVVDDYRFPSGHKRILWHCKCDCGNEVDVYAGCLRSGNTQSCGCLNSRLERDVMEYFQQIDYVQDVDYEYQKSYSDLVGLGGGKLRYDFLVYRDKQPYCFIECQGKQHYMPVEHFGGDEQFEIQQCHDELKFEYAERLGIPLIEIPYTADTYEKVVALLQAIGI